MPNAKITQKFGVLGRAPRDRGGKSVALAVLVCVPLANKKQKRRRAESDAYKSLRLAGLFPQRAQMFTLCISDEYLEILCTLRLTPRKRSQNRMLLRAQKLWQRMVFSPDVEQVAESHSSRGINQICR
jgi:cytochrome oxidase assembly protein ShyY1